MKKLILLVTLITSFSITVQAQKKSNLDLKKSTVNWAGSLSFGFGGHDGTIKLKDGEIIKDNGKVTGGRFDIDMNSIVNTDGEYNQDLIDHLKDEDFFNVKEYPLAELVITNVYYHDPNNTPNSIKTYFRVNANLAIKGISQPIEFEAETDDEHTEIRARFKIDRTSWEINYGSKGFSDRLKNNIISDVIEFNILLKMN